MANVSKRGRGLRPPKKRRGGLGLVLVVVLLLFLAGGLYVGVQAYTRITELPPVVFATPVPVTGTPEPTPDPLEPVNILLVGVDRREGAENALNDVNIVVHVDPVNRFASMLSIPRDTRVTIPGYLPQKINAAYSLGERNLADAGGGPILAKRTVEAFLGIKIHYYAEVDFQGFERIVDLLDGVTIDAPFPLVDNEYPTEDYGYTRIYIPAGLQHMDGKTALQYARSRHGDPHADFGRNQRQQQVLLALRERILRFELLTDLVTGSGNIDELLQEAGSTFKTDLPKGTLIKLARLAPRIEADRIEGYALDPSNCLSEIPGTYDLQPNMACVYDMVDQFRTDPTTRRLREEGAQVDVRNGTLWCTGCAGRTAEFLRRRGIYIADIGDDAAAGSYTHTLILDLDGTHPYTRNQLAQWLNVGPDHVRAEVEDNSTADIVIILGEDYEVPGE